MFAFQTMALTEKMAGSGEPVFHGFQFRVLPKYDPSLHGNARRAKIWILDKFGPLKTADGQHCVMPNDVLAFRFTERQKGEWWAQVSVTKTASDRLRDEGIRWKESGSIKGKSFLDWAALETPFAEAKRAPPTRQPQIVGFFGPVLPFGNTIAVSAISSDADLKQYVDRELPGNSLSVKLVLHRKWKLPMRHAQFSTSIRGDVDRLLSMQMPELGYPYVQQLSHPVRCCTKCWRTNSHGLSRCSSPTKLCPRCRGSHKLGQCSVQRKRCFVCRIADPGHDSNDCPKLDGEPIPWAHVQEAAAARAAAPAAAVSFATAGPPAVGTYAAAAAGFKPTAVAKELSELRAGVQLLLECFTALLPLLVSQQPAAADGRLAAVLEQLEKLKRKTPPAVVVESKAVPPPSTNAAALQQQHQQQAPQPQQPPVAAAAAAAPIPPAASVAELASGPSSAAAAGAASSAASPAAPVTGASALPKQKALSYREKKQQQLAQKLQLGASSASASAGDRNAAALSQGGKQQRAASALASAFSESDAEDDEAKSSGLGKPLLTKGKRPLGSVSASTDTSSPARKKQAPAGQSSRPAAARSVPPEMQEE